jgi:endonuclease III related protein
MRRCLNLAHYPQVPDDCQRWCDIVGRVPRSEGRDGAVVMAIYRRLRGARGHAGWWPGETPFEVCLGAILTQNTSWSNVDKALGALRRRGRLSYESLRTRRPSRIAPLIRSSGYFNVKARRLAAFLRFLGREYGGRVEAMAAEEPAVLRAKLLSVTGIGRETADSIALYAAGLPLFVVDAYTRRIFTRLGLLDGNEDYDTIQRMFMDRLPLDAALYNDYHAQIVLHGKEVCRTVPRCGACVLDRICLKRGLVDRREPVLKRKQRPGTRAKREAPTRAKQHTPRSV